MLLTVYSVASILPRVAWVVEVTDRFEAWWNGLNEDERVSIDGMIRVLEAQGPSIGPPYSIEIGGGRYTGLRQLRVPHHGREIRVLYISEPARAGLVLLTGTTAAAEDQVCPPELVALADNIYERHVASRRSS